ncbi:hypothetical protein H7B90_04465 [Cohnella xylanilytica]|uniref:Butirosin biosynthesis protein H-like n=1 Tax=Cohnella xylanilytica TaxID=557555 RepID=A0A841TUP7_9BACL|nr:hypothetical protein [Cohnella xylanilytica]MBB6690652.1 hypothetical protein [Cohnella xylanilytica]
MQVPLFDPLLEIPYYYPCNFPLIHEVLKRQGSTSSLALLANARLYGLPACSDTGLVKTYFNKLDYEEAVWLQKGKEEAPSFEEGLNRLRERLREGRLFLATGSSYRLPYCEDYLNPKYIEKLVEPGSRLYLVDHWLAVYGIENGRALVYDPVPSRYVGPISLEAFESFWRGNKSIPELAAAKRKEELHSFGSVVIEAERRLGDAEYGEALRSTLATEAHEFLSGREIRDGERTYFFGHAVSLQLTKKLHLGMEGEDSSLAALSAFAFDMRWSRYFFRDLLREAADRLGSPYGELEAEFAGIVSEWEGLHRLLQGQAANDRARERLLRFGAKLEALVLREHKLYEKLAAETRTAGLFRKRAEKRSDLAAAGPREAVARIVLDSCREINAYRGARIPVELGERAPLYGRDGSLDSLGLVSLLASVEQGIEDELGVGISLSDSPPVSSPESPYRTVDSLIGYLLSRWPKSASVS